MAYETPQRRDGYLKAAHQWQCHAGVTPAPGSQGLRQLVLSHPHAAAATSPRRARTLISLLRVAVVVGQRVDVDVVVCALEVQVLALHI